jgi:uncharacterized membrane protein
MKSMHAMKPLITAGVVAALGLAPAAFAQTAPATQSSQTAAPQTSPSGTSQQPETGGSGNQEVARQALAAARQSLAELTKLPAASSLQGEQRTAIANFISDFNAFATAQTDWRSKYEVVDESLTRLLGEASATTGAPSTSGTPPAPTTPGATPNTPGATGSGAAAGGGALDPAIIAKLQEVRTHLDEFEQASGDPLFAVDAIQKQLDAATSSGASAGVTLSPAQVEAIRKQLDTIRQAAKK